MEVSLSIVIAIAVPSIGAMLTIIFYFVKAKFKRLEFLEAEMLTNRSEIQDIRKDVKHNKELLDHQIKQMMDNVDSSMKGLGREIGEIKELLNRILLKDERQN